VTHPSPLPFTVREVSVAHLATAHERVVVDVREPGEYVGGHVPGAILIPLAQVRDRANEVPIGSPVYVICQSGNRSMFGAELLNRAGHEAYSVTGGTGRWIMSGNPVVTGPNPS
jgi:rhodanese-related sulfurtransferase